MKEKSARYEATKSICWKKKPEYKDTPGPERVSIYGALPSPEYAYTLSEDGWAIRDNKNGTVSDYFFGKIGIATEDEAREIISRLEGKP